VPVSEVSEEDAPAHVLRKWEGRLKKNMDRHGVGVNAEGYLSVWDDHSFSGFDFRALTCAYCEHCGDDCGVCQAVLAGMDRCNADDGPYDIFKRTGSIRPILAWVRKAKRLIDAQRKGNK